MEKSQELFINHSEEKTELALKLVDSFIRRQGLTGKKAIHLRLLAEETLGMVRAMAGDFRALFWLEAEDGEYRVRLMAETNMDADKKNELLSVSTSGKNALARGFMGKIGELFESASLYFQEMKKLQSEYEVGFLEYGSIPGDISGHMPPFTKEQFTWSMQKYRKSLSDASDTGHPFEEAWDELEKSIVASIARDVVVGVKKDRVDMTIIL